MAEIHLVTGYLGSGKTQFLSALLERKLFREKIAVIVNDFGAVMFDGLRLQAASGAEGLEILDVPGGCLCCSAIEDFREALQNVLSRGVERVFIEATGLADAAQVQRDLAFMRFPIDSTLCIVDVRNIHRFQKLFHIVNAQIAAADVLLFSKTDLATEERFLTVQSDVERINPRAKKLVLEKGRLPADALLQLFAPRHRFVSDAQTAHQEHLLQENITAFRIFLAENVDFTLFEQVLKRLPNDLFRLKGVLRFDDSSKVLLCNYIAGAWNYQPLEESHATSELFAIGQNLDANALHEVFALLGARIESGTVRSFGLVEPHEHAHHHSHSE